DHAEAAETLLREAILLAEALRPAFGQIDVLVEADDGGMLGASEAAVQAFGGAAAATEEQNLVRRAGSKTVRGQKVGVQTGFIGHAGNEGERRCGRLSVEFVVSEALALEDEMRNAEVVGGASGMEVQVLYQRLGSLEKSGRSGFSNR